MAMGNFLLYVKSTIDRFGSDLATALAISNKADLDDIANTKELLASDETIVVWEVTTLTDSPMDPLYELLFSIGIKTTKDPSNYNMMSLLGQVQNMFPQGANLPIMDYSGDLPPTVREGDMTISDVRVAPQQFDRASGIRLITVRAMVVRGG